MTECQVPPSDTPNLIAFFDELRASLPSNIISLSIPVGSWFLKEFELGKIAQNLDMINVMSLDYRKSFEGPSRCFSLAFDRSFVGRPRHA